MKTLVTDEMVRAAGDIIIAHANAPEQAIYSAARIILEESALSVKQAVLTEAIEAVKYEAQFFDANGKQTAKRIVSVIQKMLGVSGNRPSSAETEGSAQALPNKSI